MKVEERKETVRIVDLQGRKFRIEYIKEVMNVLYSDMQQFNVCYEVTKDIPSNLDYVFFLKKTK